MNPTTLAVPGWTETLEIATLLAGYVVVVWAAYVVVVWAAYVVVVWAAYVVVSGPPTRPRSAVFRIDCRRFNDRSTAAIRTVNQQPFCQWHPKIGVMNRRGFLRGTAVAGTVAIAGCLEGLGFEEQSAWSNPPLVDDRPNAVYLPAGTEEMGTYGRATDGEYAVELTYTIPHRFWLVAGEIERIDVDADDSMHLMLTVWDPETDTVLPVNAELDVLRDGDSVTGQLSPWPMLSQRMGFHYGDNISLPDEGEYTARIRIGRLEAEGTGAFEDRFDSPSTLEIDFEFNRSDIHDLEFELIDEDRRGERDAL